MKADVQMSENIMYMTNMCRDETLTYFVKLTNRTSIGASIWNLDDPCNFPLQRFVAFQRKHRYHRPSKPISKLKILCRCPMRNFFRSRDTTRYMACAPPPPPLPPLFSAKPCEKGDLMRLHRELVAVKTELIIIYLNI